MSVCPWSWHGLPCALDREHPSPHHIVGEQPQFDAVLDQAEAQVAALREALGDIANRVERDWTHGEECAAWVDDDDESYVDDPAGDDSRCDCGVGRLIRDARAALSAPVQETAP